MSNRRILFIVDHLQGGGAERVMLDVAHNLAKHNNVSIALLNSSNIRMNISSKINQIDLNINKDFLKGSLWRRGNRKLQSEEISKIQNIIDNINPELIILSHWYAFHIRPYINGNIWFWIHGEIFTPTRKKTENLFRWYKESRRLYFELKNFPQLLDNENLIFVNSKLSETYKPYIPNSNVKIIHNGIDYERLLSSLNDDISTKIWDCLFVGRLSCEKQPSHALIAFAKSDLKGRIGIIGDGNEMNALINLSRNLGIDDRVDFIGWKHDVANYIKQSRIVLSTSLSEGCPLIIAESILLDVPVVAYECAEGISFQLSSNQLYRGLVPPQNIELLVQTINDIYNNPYPILNIDKERLSIKNMVLEFEKLI